MHALHVWTREISDEDSVASLHTVKTLGTFFTQCWVPDEQFNCWVKISKYCVKSVDISHNLGVKLGKFAQYLDRLMLAR